MVGIWRPALLESADGLPLAKKIGDLFVDFPYERLPENVLLQAVLRPECLVVILCFYLLSKPIFVRISKIINPKASWFVFLIALHNFLLAAFSLVVVVNFYRIVFGHYER